jgi:hypothetical protein
MMQIGVQAGPPAFPQPCPAAREEAAGRQPGRDSDFSGPRAASVEDQPLFVSPPPLPFPRVFPGL